MTTRLDSAQVPRDDRVSFVKEALRANVLPLEVQHHDREVAFSLERTDLADISLQAQSCSDTTFWRTATQARDDAPPTVYLALQRSGAGRVSQDGRHAVLRPGDMTLTRSNGAATVDALAGSNGLHLLIPAGQLGVHDRTLRQVTAVRLGRDLALARIVASHVEQLAASPSLRPAEAMALVGPTVAMVRALVAVTAAEPSLASGPLAETLQQRIVAYLHEHWLDEGLNADRLARVHHISQRHVYTQLRAAGIDLGDWLRARRLQACRDELAEPGALRSNVSDIGRRWGFSNPTTFGRAFKHAYGLTPGEWRRASARPFPAARPIAGDRAAGGRLPVRPRLATRD